MKEKHLIWNQVSGSEKYRSKVLTVKETESISPKGERRTFTVIDCPDWVIVVPVINGPDGKQFIMVRQWRHGSGEISVEFPGGVIENGEIPDAGAAREMEEETAYKPGRLIKLGAMGPNPAVMSNRVHFYLATDLSPLPRQNLDEDEFVDVELLSEEEVMRGMGKPPFIHALTATALGLYLLTK